MKNLKHSIYFAIVRTLLLITALLGLLAMSLMQAGMCAAVHNTLGVTAFSVLAGCAIAGLVITIQTVINALHP